MDVLKNKRKLNTGINVIKINYKVMLFKMNIISCHPLPLVAIIFSTTI